MLDEHRSLDATIKEYRFFLNTQRTFTKIDYNSRPTKKVSTNFKKIHVN